MANIADNTGLQTVAPSENPPNAELHIDAGPEKFGAAAARGQEKLGEGEGQAAAGGFSALRFYNEAAADHATNDYQDSLNKILHGDPNKMVMGPDGQQTPDTGFLGLKGRAAMDARAGVEKQIGDLQEKTKGTLLAPASQFDFDRYSSRLRAVTTSQIGTHADTQQNAWQKETAVGEVKVNTASLVANVDNPELVQQFAGGIVNGYVKIAMQDGAKEGDPVYQAAVQKGKAAAARAQILAVGAKPDGAPAADRMVENYKGILGEDYHVLKDHFRARVEEEGAEATGNNVFKEVTGRGTNPLPPTGDAKEAVRHFEGLITTPKRDTDGKLRVGYGSDTYTTPDGKSHPVTADTVVTKEDAERDLARRVGETQTGIAAKIGDDAWKALPDTAKASLTSVAYNYGSLPDSVVAAAKSNDPAAIATAIRALSPHNNGINAGRRFSEAGNVGEEGRMGLAADPGVKEAEGAQAKFARQMQEGVDKIDGMNLSPKEYQRTMRAFRESMATHEIAENLKEKAKTETYHKALGGYVDDMVSGNFGGMVDRIKNDPSIPPEHKMPLIEMARHQSGQPVDPKSYGPGWLEATRGVMKNPGEEGYIGDASAIVKMGPAGTGQLTASGVQDVLKTQADSRKDIDQHGIQQSRASVMKWAESQMVVDHSNEAAMMGLMTSRKDKKGEDAFNGTFVPKVNAAYAEFMKKPNANPIEFWTQENMQKLMEGVRSQKEIQEEKLQGALAAAPAEDAAKIPIPAAPPDVNPTSWESIVRQPPLTTNGKAWPVKNWAVTVDRLRADPSPEMMKAFDEKFGASGHDAKSILEHLHKPPPAAPGGWSDFAKGQSVPGLYNPAP